MKSAKNTCVDLHTIPARNFCIIVIDDISKNSEVFAFPSTFVTFAF